jgi:dihydrofolate reductase
MNNQNKKEKCNKKDDLFIIGGGQIFEQTIDLASLLYITHVEIEAAGDSYFPKINPEKWRKVEEEKRNGFSFAKYTRVDII